MSGVITLNRPDARNALTFTTYAELEDAVRGTTARCLVVTGADPAFCSGDDVKQIMAGAGDRVATGLHTAPAPDPRGRRAAVHRRARDRSREWRGRRLGHGAGADGRHPGRLGERRRFGELFVKRGLCCDVAGLGRLAQLVGREHAAELLFTGRVIDADEAARIGLVVPGRAARGAAAHGAAAGGGDRIEPAARRAAPQAWAARSARSRLERPRVRG